MKNKRSSGVLLHISSLPGAGPIGNFGPAAFAFVDFLKRSKQSWWQVLPLNPIGEGNSPYSTISSFAGEHLYIDRNELFSAIGFKGGLRKTKSTRFADYKAARLCFNEDLRKAFEHFVHRKQDQREPFQRFLRAQKFWLDDYTLFVVLADQLGTDWAKWPEPLRNRHSKALSEIRLKHAKEILYHNFLQYHFYRQLRLLRQYANQQGIGLVGDIPIFVSHGSADVWAHQQFFQLDRLGRPQYVAGVPPDFFNRDGQLWGNALYDWDKLKRDNFHWWVQRLTQMLHLFDLIRIDHFIGFTRYWRIPGKAKNARSGRWISVPGHDFFKAVQREIPSMPFIAEDLGSTTPEVFALRDAFGLPGMRVAHMGFGANSSSAYHRPFSYPENSVAYTGTHDNDTTVGWFQQATREVGQKNRMYNLNLIKTYLNPSSKTVHWDLARSIMNTPARMVILPAQDLLGLNTKSRMNIPGTAKGNWIWRLQNGDLSSDIEVKLRELTIAFGRESD